MRRLVIRPGAIGDFIVSLPAIECLRSSYLEVWARRANVPLARCAGRACAIEDTGLDLMGVTATEAALLERLRAFDSIVSWYGTNRPEFRELAASLALPFHFLPALPPDGAGMHAADFYLEQVRGLASCASDGIPRIACPGQRGGFAVIHPFAGGARKRWPLERFRELARELARRMPVRWCAGPEDELPGAVRMDNLYDLACWLAGARVYVGNDSGISHLAAAARTKVVVLFGPTDPRVWAPRGPAVRVIARGSMQEIGVPEVLEAAIAP